MHIEGLRFQYLARVKSCLGDCYNNTFKLASNPKGATIRFKALYSNSLSRQTRSKVELKQFKASGQSSKRAVGSVIATYRERLMQLQNLQRCHPFRLTVATKIISLHLHKVGKVGKLKEGYFKDKISWETILANSLNPIELTLMKLSKL